MKKRIFVFDNYVFVDIITNSSSELFLIGGKKDVEAVKSILAQYLDKYNSDFADELDEPLKGDDVWKILDVSSDMDALKTIISIRAGKLIHPTKGNISPMTFKEFRGDNQSWEAYMEYKNKWVEENAEMAREAIGKVVLVQSSDYYSMPNELVQWLQGKPLFANYYRID